MSASYATGWKATRQGECRLKLDKPARLIVRLLFGFTSDSVFASDSVIVKLTKNVNKYWDGNAV